MAIARVLASDPKLLLCDEATSALDPQTTRSILALLKELQQQDGLTVIMNSHNLAMSQEFSDRLLGLSEGRLLYDGTVDDATEEVLSSVYASAGDSTP